uniref:Uncharacterized protein n=1 Tax=Schistocephalus solidus TaxID=70667 RepID=A0A0X3PZ93_SCHSO
MLTDHAVHQNVLTKQFTPLTQGILRYFVMRCPRRCPPYSIHVSEPASMRFSPECVPLRSLGLQNFDALFVAFFTGCVELTASLNDAGVGPSRERPMLWSLYICWHTLLSFRARVGPWLATDPFSTLNPRKKQSCRPWIAYAWAC